MNAAFGRYRLLERLGQGGMAEVFKAKSYGVEGFEKILVIKRILPELARSKDFVDMFVHEAKLAVRLSHANIVQVFDLGRAPGGDAASGQTTDAYYMAMEYVHGFDLATVLSRARRTHTTLPVEMGAYVASEVAKGLDHAHRRRDEQSRPLGIVHRDVSPQNVLLSFEGEVKVTDFGIAKARGAIGQAPEDTHARKLQGKFGYMSPEQAVGDSVDGRSDIFSLGTVLYECIAGVNPFTAPTTFETLRRVQSCEYPPLELLRPDASPALIAIVKTAMAKNLADRYPDVGRMYEELLAFIYAQGGRYGAHDLAQFLAQSRSASERAPSSPDAQPLLEAEANPRTERTPVEIPSNRPSSSVRPAGTRNLAIDRAVELGERREVTCLVIELPRQTPPSVVERAATIVERWGGRVLRREPGHIAALFGLSDPDGRDTEMATRCALVALRSLDVSPAPGAGLHSARIQLSRAAEPKEDERFGTLLDTAHDLARVREGQVAISAQAMRQVKDLFEFEPMSESDNPGERASGVLVKEVRGPGETFGRFVGRKDELRRVGEVLAMATRRTARVLTIRGDNGVGKTRLLYEVERRLRKGGYNVGFHIATCPPQGADFPLSGLVCMLQVLCGTAEGDTDERILAVQPRLRALGLQGDEVNAVLAVLGANVTSSTGNAKALLLSAFGRMVQSLCEDRPHTFAWDVAHAIDEDTFSLLMDVLQRLKQTRVVFLLAARAGFTHPLETTEGHVALDLGDLAPADLERLVALRLGVDQAPDEIVRFVRARAGGHPLFAEEVLKGLLDAGAIGVAERRVVSMKLVGQDLALPKTLRGLVSSRVARLSADDRAALQAAAVMGDPLHFNVLANMIGQSMPAMERSIAMLQQRDFLVYTGPSELRFTSPLIPEIVADALTAEAAREMHAAAGQALETTLGNRAWEQAARIAHHLYEAGDRERAAKYFAKSGERRLETRQLEAAARDYARAIALADPAKRSPDELAAWLSGLASAARLVRSLADAAELSDRVIRRADEAGARELRVRVRVAAAQILAAVQDVDGSLARLAEAETIAEGDEQLSKAVLIAEAELATRQGDFKRSWSLLEKLHRIVKAVSDDQERHRVALDLAQAAAGLGDHATALASLREAEQILPDDRVAAVERMKARSLVDSFAGDFRSAVLHSGRAIDMGRELGLTYEVMLNLHNLGLVLVYVEDLPRAYGAIRQSLAICEERGYERLTSYNRLVLAYLDGLQGNADAEKVLRQGLAYAESKHFSWDVLGGRALLARLLQRTGRPDAARSAYELARSLAVNMGHKAIVDECDRALKTLGPAAPPPASVGRESAS
jgi:serine/threonine protein kinase/tetratricopeptide (TPR) repeat protein